jgi:hypothetical protein
MTTDIVIRLLATSAWTIFIVLLLAYFFKDDIDEGPERRWMAYILAVAFFVALFLFFAAVYILIWTT